MYDKVNQYWRRYCEELQARLLSEADWEKRAQLSKDIDYMCETDMSVVVSQAQNEIEDFRKKGLDIYLHIYESYYGEGKSIYAAVS